MLQGGRQAETHREKQELHDNVLIHYSQGAVLMLPTTQAVSMADVTSIAPMRLRTTLCDLVAAINEEVGVDEEKLVLATLVRIFQTYKVTSSDGLQEYRLVCDDAASPTLVSTCGNC
jgi:hypothetical protein